MKTAVKLFLLCLTITSFAQDNVLFFDDFDTNESYYDTLSLNPTSKVYKTNSLKEGHLLKKWNQSWEYQYFEGDWRQAFYCVAPGDSVMIQAGRSARFHTYTFRITADAVIPDSIDHYIISFRMYKHDNDPVYFCIGCDKRGYQGVEFGYENQLPGTDETVRDAYLRGQFGEGVFKEGMAFLREWVNVTIDVDLPRKFITWKMNDEYMARGYARDLKRGGYFGLYMSYERNTKFDDFEIRIKKGK